MVKKELDTMILPAPSSSPQNFFDFWSGLALQVLNKLRRSIIGYTSAGGFYDKSPITAIDYHRQVIAGWLKYWEALSGQSIDIHGKNILELGPGADLGLGSIFLAKGAEKYYCLDVFDLAAGFPDDYYQRGLDHVKDIENLDEQDFPEIIRQIQKSMGPDADRFHYRIDPTFNIDILPENEMDVVFSNAAFQQFDDPAKSIQQLSRTVKPGGAFLSTIDFTTHTRWIRDRDPLNIYRYPSFVYKPLRFKGSPNRFHTQEYIQALKDAGWEDIKVFSMESYPKDYMDKIQKSFSRPYNDSNRDMSVATLVVYARNGKK